MAFSHQPHKAVISDFLDAIEQRRDPAIPGEEALATQHVIDAIINKGV
jgi:predicted dehydrogenase